jgi:hypothetical protein
MDSHQQTETMKCRVCGNLNEFYLWDEGTQDNKALVDYRYNRIQAPTFMPCSHCACETVQDVVKFNF